MHEFYDFLYRKQCADKAREQLEHQKLYELWVREEYESLIRNEQLKTLVRPEKRDEKHPKAVPKNAYTRIRIIKIPGDETSGTMPEFKDITKLAYIVDVLFKQIKEIMPSDLIGSSLDCINSETIMTHLKHIYNRDFKDGELVTLVKLEYWPYPYL